MQDEKKFHSIKKVHLNQKDRVCGVRGSLQYQECHIWSTSRESV